MPDILGCTTLPPTKAQPTAEPTSLVPPELTTTAVPQDKPSLIVVYVGGGAIVALVFATICIVFCCTPKKVVRWRQISMSQPSVQPNHSGYNSTSGFNVTVRSTLPPSAVFENNNFHNLQNSPLLTKSKSGNADYNSPPKSPESPRSPLVLHFRPASIERIDRSAMHSRGFKT